MLRYARNDRDRKGGKLCGEYLRDKPWMILGGQTILYINKYYEVNLTTGNATSYYYHGSRLAAMSENSTLRYVHQDHLTGTALVTDTTGASLGAMKYYPFGGTRSGSVPTDKKFTGRFYLHLVSRLLRLVLI